MENKNLYKNLERQYNKIFRHIKVGSFKTRERYGKAFKRFMVFLADEYRIQKLANISPKHIFAYIDYMQKKDLSASTIKTELAAIRFFRDSMPYTRYELPTNSELSLERRNFGGVDRTWSKQEFNNMVAIAMQNGREDYVAIFTIARYAGLRLEECFRIDINDAQNALITGRLFVKGKGGLTRYVPINESIRIEFEKHKFKMGEIKALHLQAYYGEMLEKGKKDGSGGLSPKTIKNHHTIIRKSLQDAVRNEMIPSNPADLVKLPKKQKFIGEFYTLSQANSLIESSKDTEFYIAVVLALYTGCRRSEILGFKWESVNWENSTITVKDTVVRAKTVIYRRGTKTDSSYRTLQLTEGVMEILKEEKAKQEEYERLFGSEYIKNDYIVKRANGELYIPNTFTSCIQRCMKKAGLPVIRFHDLRHTTASLLISLGLSLKEVQEWLGHSDISTTANIYTHIMVKTKIESANRYAQVLKI